jgi:protein lifeguard
MDSAKFIEPLFDGKISDDFKFSEINERHAFIKKVYLILIVMLSVTISISAIFMGVDSVKEWSNQHEVALMVPCMVFVFVFLFMMMCIPDCRYKSPHKWIVLSLFTLCISVLMGITTSHYDTNIVLLAFGATATITIALTIFAFQTKWDFTGAGPYLLAVLVGLIFMGIIQIWVYDQVLHTVTASIGAILFSFYIIYDTQLMLDGDHKNSIGPEEHVFAAISLYLDIINLFVYLLQLIGGDK